jgi:DNA-binding MarR family transcriptional regulator
MTEIHHMPGHLIRRINQISVSLFQDRMRAEGLDLTPVQFAALTTLRDHPGVDQARLAGMIAYDRATIGGVIDRLEAKNLVTRQISARDRRAREVRLTDAGAALLNRITPVVRRLQSDILVGLDEAERAQFLALAEKVATAGNAQSRAPLVLPEERDAAPV